KGQTLFVTTHYMDEAERCDRIAYIYLSKLMVMGTPSELKSLPDVRPANTKRLAVLTDRPSTALAVLKRQAYALDATLVESEVHLVVPEQTTNDEIIQSMTSAGLPESAIRPIEPSLEDVFVTITRKLAHEKQADLQLNGGLR